MYEEYVDEIKKDVPQSFDLSDIWPMFFVVLFYTTSVGSERVLHNIEFTFGICGPLKLSPTQAVFIDKCFNAGFMIGRYQYCMNDIEIYTIVLN